MPTVSPDQAVELLTKAVQEELPADEVLEIHNELFPKQAVTEEEAKADPGRLVKRLVDHIKGERYTEEIVDLWNFFGPGRNTAWYNEEENLIYYTAQSEWTYAD